MLKIYNTLTKEKEVFVPINGKHVGIYACGITPYKSSHLGHAMQAIIFDILRSYLEYLGYDVTYVRNYTDVDDKIILRAQELNIDPLIHANNMIKKSEKEFEALRIKPATFSPKVTDNMNLIISMVQELIDKDIAYVTTHGNVYFKVKNFKDYGKLSRQKLDMLLTNVRIDLEEDKLDPLDFAVWKSSKPNEIFWESPWGKGRPGWHIECSVMSLKHLSESFEIHGGGVDLIFPHHENEKAQSESIHIDPNSHKGHYAKYWVYNGLLMVNDQKMSKSLQNDISIESMLNKYDPEVIRYMIISNHYRSHINFVESRYTEANKNVYAIYKTLLKIRSINITSEDFDNALFNKYMVRFDNSMNDDFNTAEVISHIHEFTTQINMLLSSKNLEEHINQFNAYSKYMDIVGNTLNLFNVEPQTVIDRMDNKILLINNIDRSYINKMINLRQQHRNQKEFDKSDEIRELLESNNIILLDDKDSTNWEVKY